MSEMSPLEKLVERTKANPLDRENWIAQGMATTSATSTISNLIGKALGWKYKAYKKGKWETEETDLSYLSHTPFRQPEWQFHAHKWFDAHFQGQEAEDKLWEKLLNI